MSCKKAGTEKKSDIPGDIINNIPGISSNFTWKIDNFNSEDKEILSKITIDSLEFDLKLCKPQQQSGMINIKIILQTPTPTARKVYFTVILKNFLNPERSINKKSNKAYKKINDYESIILVSLRNITIESGFLDSDGSALLTLSYTTAAKKGVSNTSSPKFILDEEVKHSVSAENTDTNEVVPHCSSKELTGYVGLRNQGATCYMNSLLQSLFHLPSFRRIVYKMPTTGTERVEISIPLNLQRLFCMMQLGKSAPSTADLTKSFGWNQRETMQQQDVQEFCRVLLQNLIDKLRSTDLSSSIDSLFCGHTRTYIEFPDLKEDFKKEIIEEFKDLSLVVKNIKNLRESLHLELQRSELDEPYDTGDYGKQRAVMGMEYLDFPSILHIHLRRFDRDPFRSTFIKINDRFEFPKEIDLSEFLAKDAARNKGSVYDLYGVLVHSGGYMCGHYYCYLKTTANSDQWFKFDDMNVTYATDKEAIDNNFGGKNGENFSGYMLVYVRRDDVNEIFKPVPDENVPQHLREFLTQMMEGNGPSNLGSLELRVTDENTLALNCIKCKTGFDSMINQKNIHIPRNHTIEDLYNTIASLYEIDRSTFRLWKCSQYSTPSYILTPSNDLVTKHLPNYTLVFVNTLIDYVNPLKPKDEEKVVYDLLIPEDKICIFTKFFFYYDEPCINYIGSLVMNSNSSFRDLCEEINRRTGLPEGTQLLGFLEEPQKTATLVTGNTLSECRITTGSIVIFQILPGSGSPQPSIIKSDKVTSKQKLHLARDHLNLPIYNYVDAYPECRPITVEKFLDRRLRTIKVVICPVSDPKQPTAILRFPSNLKWSAIKVFMAKSLNILYSPENDSIQLFKRDPQTMVPMKKPINMRLSTSLSMIINDDKAKTGAKKEKLWIFYQIFKGIPENLLNSTTNYNVCFSSNSITVDVHSSLIMPNTATTSEIAEEMINRCLMTRCDCLRVFAVSYHRFINMIDLNKPPIDLKPDASIRFEVVPVEQRDTGKMKIVPVCRGFIDNNNIPHLNNDPFLFHVDESELFGDLKVRMLKYIEAQDDSMKLMVLCDKKVIDGFSTAGDALGYGGTLILLEQRPASQSLKSSPPTGFTRSQSSSSLKILN